MITPSQARLPLFCSGIRLSILLAVALAASGVASAKEFSFNDKIVGETQKPTIDILISRQNLTPKYVLDLKESFLPKVVDAVNSKPF